MSGEEHWHGTWMPFLDDMIAQKSRRKAVDDGVGYLSRRLRPICPGSIPVFRF